MSRFLRKGTAQTAGSAWIERPFARRMIWNVVPAMVVVGALWMALGGEDGLLERHVLKQRLMSMGERVSQLEAENDEIRQQIRRLREEPAAVKRAVATQILAADAGSTIYRFSDGEGQAAANNP